MELMPRGSRSSQLHENNDIVCNRQSGRQTAATSRSMHHHHHATYLQYLLTCMHVRSSTRTCKQAVKMAGRYLGKSVSQLQCLTCNSYVGSLITHSSPSLKPDIVPLSHIASTSIPLPLFSMYTVTPFSQRKIPWPRGSPRRRWCLWSIKGALLPSAKVTSMLSSVAPYPDLMGRHAWAYVRQNNQHNKAS